MISANEVEPGRLRVLVTAGAAGIGLEIARAFAQQGAHVHVCDIDHAALDALASLPESISRSWCDVSDRDAVAGMFEHVLQELGGLDVLVNNAGIAGPVGRVDRIAPQDWDRTLQVNLTGQFNVTRLAVPLLIGGARSSIVCMSSAAGRFAFPNRSAYAASKWGVVGFMKTLAAELGEHGIRVNAILPGMVDGPRLRSVLSAKATTSGTTPQLVEQMALAGASVKSLVSPQSVAAVAVFLASDAGRAISGQAIAVDNDLQYMI